MGGLEIVFERIAAAVERVGRRPDEVTLLAVSKGRTPEAIAALHASGQRDFGENRAGELAEKAPLLPGDIRWHFVGVLQSRKAAQVRAYADVLHSLDRLSLVRRWSEGSGPAPPAYVQVNVAAEPQKAGVTPADLGALLEAAASAGIPLAGLMAIPPAPERAEENRRWFAELRRLRDLHAPDHPGLTGLSMGMTDDFEVAIEEGSTVVRLGRAIFESGSK